MQGRNLLESGDAAGAVATLRKISDIDSKPDGLRDLLKAYLQSGQLSEAGTVANKLLAVHNDLPAISSFADALMQAGQYENALQVFDQHAERLLAENSSKMLESLHAIIGHVRDNPDSLQKLLDLFNKGGDTSHVSEVMELLAHASVQSGDLTRSRDLYQKLAQVEPQNALHMQNYQQVVAQIGGTSGSKLITPEEAVVLLDDLESTAPAIHQHYSDEVALSIRSALTDAELFISYNMPAKALGPLVAALPQAPSDLRINQRLATLHTRAGRFAEAAVCCRTLQSIYSEADYPEEATRYGELAERYEERTSTAAPVVSDEEAPIFIDAPAAKAEQPEPGVAEFSVEEASAEISAPEAEAAETEEPASAKTASPWPKPVKSDSEPEFAIVDEAAPTESTGLPEIDLSSEWDDSLAVEAEAAGEEPANEAAEIEAAAPAAPVAKVTKPLADSAVDETAEEIRFYIAHSMLEQAMAALVKLQTLTKDQAKLAELRAEVEAASQAAAEEEAAAAAEPVVEDLTADDVPSFDVVEEAPVAIEEPAAVVPEPEPVEEAPVVAEAPVEPEPPDAKRSPVLAKPAPITPKPAPVAPKAAPTPVVHEPEPQPAVLKEFVTDLESSLGDGFLPGTVTKPAAASAPPPQPKPAVAATPAAPVLGEFVADIEASLGEDFLAAAPVAEPQRPALKAAPVPPPAPPATPRVSPLAASAAASASPSSHIAPPIAAPVSPAPVASVASSPVVSAPRPQPPVPAIPAHAPAASAKASPFAEDAGVDLAEMFGELKQDLEADVAAADEDPETHYNLGIAFREMGLLDEAIGELQKACQSFDKGHPFPQIMQTYTWLAQCFLEKSVPEAAIRWYEKALKVPTIDGETRTALNYELASAYEAAGDKPSALKHFMDVYGSNIDYRDVAERIKALKS
jgi:tetratricopeptide (TPR) repeat protein